LSGSAIVFSAAVCSAAASAGISAVSSLTASFSVLISADTESSFVNSGISL
jgi:hypothetical protein